MSGIWRPKPGAHVPRHVSPTSDARSADGACDAPRSICNVITDHDFPGLFLVTCLRSNARGLVPCQTHWDLRLALEEKFGPLLDRSTPADTGRLSKGDGYADEWSRRRNYWGPMRERYITIDHAIERGVAKVQGQPVIRIQRVGDMPSYYTVLDYGRFDTADLDRTERRLDAAARKLSSPHCPPANTGPKKYRTS